MRLKEFLLFNQWIVKDTGKSFLQQGKSRAHGQRAGAKLMARRALQKGARIKDKG
jgi:hypothetical protein